MTEDHDDITRYAAAVRAALDDLPEADSEDLLEDLDNHLAEVAAESEEPLAERLGSPESYAAELRAAYGARVKRSRRASWSARWVAATETVRANPAYRYVGELLGELRPAWWAARGYLAAMLVVSFFAGSTLVPRELGALVLTVLAIWASVLIGRLRSRWGQGWRGVVLAGNVLLLLAAMPFLGSVTDRQPYTDPVPSPDAYAGAYGEPRLGENVRNIYAYSKDGEPLEDVLLYDQDGRPIVIDRWVFEDRGLRADYPMGADGRPIRNAYPLTLEPRGQWATPPPSGRPRVAIPPFPSPSPTPSPTATPTGSPSPSPSGEPSPSPS